jgi:hypothetical protein
MREQNSARFRTKSPNIRVTVVILQTSLLKRDQITNRRPRAPFRQSIHMDPPESLDLTEDVLPASPTQRLHKQNPLSSNLLLLERLFDPGRAHSASIRMGPPGYLDLTDQ